MFSRTFEYEDYNGAKQKETWWFNLTKAELMEMELGAYGGLDATMKRLIREKKPDEIVKTYKELILSAVGEKSPDGKRFVKNESIREDFYQSPAYSDLFYEMVTDGAKADAFLRGAIPADLLAALEQAEAAAGTNLLSGGTEQEDAAAAPALTVVPNDHH